LARPGEFEVDYDKFNFVVKALLGWVNNGLQRFDSFL
jgi:hypothetical protein